MTKQEYFVMKIRQLNILKREAKHLQDQIEEIQKELEPLSNKEFSEYKFIADGVPSYHNLEKR